MGQRHKGENMSYYYHLEENEIQKIQTGSKNKWYIQALQARRMQLQEIIKLLECADKNNLSNGNL